MELSPVMESFVLHWGEMGSRWGLNRTVAQIYALLYIAGRPLPADEIADTLKVARSNVSTSIRELQAWELIERTHEIGDRRDHFVAETDLWTMAARIAEERKRREIDPTLAALARCLSDVRMDDGIGKDAVARIRAMHGFLESASGWYEEIRDLPQSKLETLMKMGAKVARLEAPGKKPKKKKGKR